MVEKKRQAGFLVHFGGELFHVPPASASVCDNFRRRFNESGPAENGREKKNLINWEFVYQLENGQFGHFLPLFS